jgi:hypothetical protein
VSDLSDSIQPDHLSDLNTPCTAILPPLSTRAPMQQIHQATSFFFLLLASSRLPFLSLTQQQQQMGRPSEIRNDSAARSHSGAVPAPLSTRATQQQQQQMPAPLPTRAPPSPRSPATQLHQHRASQLACSAPRAAAARPAATPSSPPTPASRLQSRADPHARSSTGQIEGASPYHDEFGEIFWVDLFLIHHPFHIFQQFPIYSLHSTLFTSTVSFLNLELVFLNHLLFHLYHAYLNRSWKDYIVFPQN